jgi:hypothetical protein
MDDDAWGEDLDFDMVEECVILASQAVSVMTPTVPEKPRNSGSDRNSNQSFQFKSPPPQQEVRTALGSSSSKTSQSSKSGPGKQLFLELCSIVTS